MELNGGGDPADWFFLAGIEHRQGRSIEARRWFDKSVAWIAQNSDRVSGREAELRAFQEEIAPVLSRKE
jgi:hypothetical protein